MKKVILAVAIAGLAISCQKVQAGGNKGVLKMENGIERYSDDVMSDEATVAVNEADAKKSAEMMSADSSKVVAQPAAVVKKDSVQAPSSAVTK